MSTTLIKTLHETRLNAWEQAKEIAERAATENRDMTAEERQSWDAANADIDRIDQSLRDMAAAQKRSRDADETFRSILGQPPRPGYRSEADREFIESIRSAARNNDRRPIEVAPAERRSGYQPGLEVRALATTSGSGMASTSFYERVILHAVDSAAVLAAGATVLTTEDGNPLKVPKTTAFSSASIVSEGGAISSSDPTLGSVQFDAYKFAFLVKVSSELLQDASFDVEGFLAEQAGVAIGNAFGTYAITGTGSSQPNGVVTAATTGVTGGTGVTGAFTADNLIDLYHSLAEPYARSASAAWIMRNATLGAVRKLKDSQNRYLFDAAIPQGINGASGTLLGRPVFADPNVAAVGLSAKSVLFGDWSKYWVRMAGALRFERSDDYAFNTDEVTFRALARIDGDLVDTTGAIKLFAGGAS